MAGKLTIWTCDWVPAGPRGFVRDLRLRWAAEEAGLACDVRTVAFGGRGTSHLDSRGMASEHVSGIRTLPLDLVP